MPRRRDVLRGGVALALGGAGAAWALEPPSGGIVLTISGQVRNPNDGAHAQFDMPMLERLPQTSFSTHTPWYSQARQFTGPLLRDVLRAAGAHGSVLRARALNDYRVDIPFEDPQRYDIIIARLLDGAPMPVRDRGPLFVVYPFDAVPELRNAVYYSRSAWQLRTIEVK
ncbi:MAG: hypothetical protein LCI02_22985 [Proteobacteria bacterium]|nr:hypothetical protein [Pseudomonadota bacterium]